MLQSKYAIGALGAIGLVLSSGCSAGGSEGPTPVASVFEAREISCEETQHFKTVDCCAVDVGWSLEETCWILDTHPDLELLVTQVRDRNTPGQDNVSWEPSCTTWAGMRSIRECVIGGVVSDEPYTVVSVIVRPAYSSDEMALLLSGTEVEASVVEVFVKVTDLESTFD